jgi:hypothetical protein
MLVLCNQTSQQAMQRSISMIVFSMVQPRGWTRWYELYQELGSWVLLASLALGLGCFFLFSYFFLWHEWTDILWACGVVCVCVFNILTSIPSLMTCNSPARLRKEVFQSFILKSYFLWSQYPTDGLVVLDYWFCWSVWMSLRSLYDNFRQQERILIFLFF